MSSRVQYLLAMPKPTSMETVVQAVSLYFDLEHIVMEGSTKRVLVSDRIKNGTHPNRRADAAAGSASRDNVDCYSKRANRQLQPDTQSAANGKDTHRMPQRRGCRSTHLAPRSGQTSRNGTRKKRQRTHCDRVKPVGMARGRRGNVRAKCGPKPTRNDPQKEAEIIRPHG
ncbi:unnamed protein product [Echinostoma caproni]|uniref:CBFD_NFYB_HMF domain-containing protein n=1 Tax=Echinostoma caproni TaxID=27848 RepID=A0A183A6J6_9TREM|nr:unnamed protein product [Echinostoma caproni]